MAFNPLVNKYVSLVETRPDALLSVKGNVIEKEQLESYRIKRSQYKTVQCEIGSGSGGHLLEAAQRDPDTLFVGFELRYKRAYRTVEKAQERGLENIYVFRADARLIESIFKPGEVNNFYVYFPDPWDRKKWKKHRILQEEFISQCHNLLSPGGSLSYKTDHRQYFQETAALINDKFSGADAFVQTAYSEDLHNSPYAGGNIITEFESLFKSKGLPVYFLKIEKIGSSPVDSV